jgi:hypothetical protein
MISIFKTSFIQVFLVSINTIFLAKGFYLGVAVAGFAISYYWVGNVKKANIATEKERIVYAFGAMCGGLTGLLTTKILL